MCRFVAYLGSPLPLAELLLTPPHSLLRQARAPRFQTHGTDNSDGFGVGWYGTNGRPERHRTTLPMWKDPSLQTLAERTSSTAILAAVRSATPGFPIEEASTQPFTDGPWLFAHNGSIDGFRDGAGARLRSMASASRGDAIEGSADSCLLFALTLDRLDAGASAGEALAGVVSTVANISGGRLNLALIDGHEIAATAWGNSLFSLRRGEAVAVASEPHDDGDGWQRLPDASLVRVRPGSVEVQPL